MRFSIGKKVGNTYVGASVSSLTVGKVILYFFTWPFILCYFILVWPFIKLYQYNKKKKQAQYLASSQTIVVDGQQVFISPAEAKAGIPHYQRIAEESTRIFQATKDPDIYFKRYDLAVENFKYLAAAYQVCGVQNNAESLLQALKSNYTLHTNAFIDRYAQSIRRKIYELTSANAKANKAEAFKNVLLEYKERLTPEILQHMEEKYEELRGLAPSK